jgi:hypothetical protein
VNGLVKYLVGKNDYLELLKAWVVAGASYDGNWMRKVVGKRKIVVVESGKKQN